MSLPALSFIDRQEEMHRITMALEKATDEDQFICIRGEAGSGKTRLAEETAALAESMGFAVGFGTALAESVVPYQAWTEVLRGFDLDHLLDEDPPPRLLGLYVITGEGEVAIRTEREGEDRLEDAVSILTKLVRGFESHSEQVTTDGELALLSESELKFIVHKGKDFHLGAVLDGQEDEIFLLDLKGLVDTIQAEFDAVSSSDEDSISSLEISMRQILDSQKYEGIDYVKGDPKLRQSRLFENVAFGLGRKASSQPTCIIIDDLQWADPSTLALLHYTVRNTKNEGVFSLGTHRVEEKGLRPHLEDMLREVHEEDLASTIDLGGLSKNYMANLAESFLGPHTLPEAFLDRLWQETRGYPLFIREVLLGLEEDESIKVQGTLKRLVRPLELLALPEMVREVIQARLNRLPKGERHLLDAAATCGTRFTATLVAKVAGEEEEKVLNGLKAITEVHGLLRPIGDSYSFDHPTVQEALYEDMPSEMRQTYHRQAAEWLELTGGPMEDIAEHYYRARDIQAAPRLLQLAEAARGKYANDEAIRFYQEALEFEEKTPERMRAFENLGEVYSLIGDYDRGIEAYNSAMELAGEKRDVAEIMVRIGKILKSKGAYDDALESCTGALDLVKGEACREESLALSQTGDLYRHKGNLDKAIENLEGGLVIAKEIGDRDLQGACLNSIGIVQTIVGNREVALANYQKALAIREETGDQRNMAGCLHNMSFVFEEGPDGRTEALDHLERAVRISERIGHLRFLGNHLNSIGLIYLEQGDYDRAHKYFAKTLAIRERIGDKEGVATSLNNIGIVQREFGDYHSALEYFEKSNEILEKTGSRWWLAESYNYLGDTHVRCGNIKKALEFADQALNLSKETGRTEDTGWARNLFGMIYREQKMWHESMENFEKSIAVFKEIGNVFGEADSRYEFGLMWKKNGEPEKAKEHLGLSIKLYEEIKAEKRLKQAKGEYDAVQTELQL